MERSVNRGSRTKVVQGPMQLPGGYPPPMDMDLEAAVLGALLLEPHVASLVFERLNADAFFHDKHRMVFEACLAIHQREQRIDMLMVQNELRSRKQIDLLGGAYFIAELTNRVGSTANIEQHIDVLLEKYMLRGCIKLSSEVYRAAVGMQADAFEVAELMQAGAMKLINGVARKEAKTVRAMLPEFLKSLQELQQSTPGMSGIPSGFANLDIRFGGWKPGKLYIIAARPAMGKTAFVVRLILNAAQIAKKPVAFFNLEMEEQEIITRMIASESSVYAKKISDGDLESIDWHKISKATGKMERTADIFIECTPGLKMLELRAKARRLVAKEGVAMIVVDYLQLMSGDGNNHNREQQISEISRGMKTMSMELNVPVICLSQLNRAVESRGGAKRPQLQDLRESGSIEQDADAVMFLYRPEEYGIETRSNGASTAGLMEVITAKFRSGATGGDDLYFRKETMHFSENPFNTADDQLPF